MNIGLFGGTFDPVHLGHTTIAAEAHRTMPLDEVHFIPCRRSPHKAGGTVAGIEERCAMIQLAIADLPWARLCRVEADRPGPGPSFSWQTVAWFRHTRPGDQLHWILGSDQWDALPAWSRPDYLASAVTFLVIPRDGAAPPGARPGFRMIPLDVRHPASATAVREEGACHFLNRRVEAYIRRNQLYGCAFTAPVP